ncbi:hypothetical protein GY45DRAFT_1323742 [Cubamyces sp. BRFM 1775]|nr:hypothetical protein GY45DRAFT_1323742 [Cubamyces sp. BRFM 1775]
MTAHQPPSLAEKLAAFHKIKNIPGTHWYKKHTHLTWCSGKEREPARRAARAVQKPGILVEQEGEKRVVPLDGSSLYDMLRARLRAVPDPPLSTVRAWADAVGVGVGEVAVVLCELVAAAEAERAHVPEDPFRTATAGPAESVVDDDHSAQGPARHAGEPIAEEPATRYESYGEDDEDDGATVYSDAQYWRRSVAKSTGDAVSPGPSGWIDPVSPSVPYHPDAPHTHSVSYAASRHSYAANVDVEYHGYSGSNAEYEQIPAGGLTPTAGYPEEIDAYWHGLPHSQSRLLDPLVYRMHAPGPAPEGY